MPMEVIEEFAETALRRSRGDGNDSHGHLLLRHFTKLCRISDSMAIKSTSTITCYFRQPSPLHVHITSELCGRVFGQSVTIPKKFGGAPNFGELIRVKVKVSTARLVLAAKLRDWGRNDEDTSHLCHQGSPVGCCFR
jgi:hypothetical protein